MVDVMGGLGSTYYASYETMMVQCLQAARKHSDTTIRLVEIMASNSPYPCFEKNPNAVEEFRNRHCLRSEDTPEESQATAKRMVKGFLASSYNHIGTWMYDKFQTATNGIKA